MQKSERLHEELAGHKPSGPLKHFWGWDNRWVGRDDPFSLFLAIGIPFEVVEDISGDGWIFLSDEDARTVSEGRLKAKVSGSHFITMDEKMSDLMEFKQQIIPELKETPYVDGVIPAVFAWYPTANKALVWNVGETKQTFQIKRADQLVRTVTVDGLDVMLISDL